MKLSFHDWFISAFHRGDYEAFCILYYLQFPRLSDEITPCTGSRLYSEMILLDMLRQVIKFKSNFISYRDIEAFLYRTAIHEAANFKTIRHELIFPDQSIIEEELSPNIADMRYSDFVSHKPNAEMMASLRNSLINKVTDEALLKLIQQLLLNDMPGEEMLNETTLEISLHMAKLTTLAGSILHNFYINGWPYKQIIANTKLSVPAITRLRAEGINKLTAIFGKRCVYPALAYLEWLRQPEDKSSFYIESLFG